MISRGFSALVLDLELDVGDTITVRLGSVAAEVFDSFEGVNYGKDLYQRGDSFFGDVIAVIVWKGRGDSKKYRKKLVATVGSVAGVFGSRGTMKKW